MALFDSLIAALGSKFGLGTKSSALVAEAIRFITSEPGGVAGFVDRLKEAGLASLVSSWLGNKNPQPMSTQQVEQGLGPGIINMIAGKLGLGGSVIAPALGHVIPKLIGMLIPTGRYRPRYRRRGGASSTPTCANVPKQSACSGQS